jgi:hypothetical protein
MDFLPRFGAGFIPAMHIDVEWRKREATLQCSIDMLEMYRTNIEQALNKDIENGKLKQIIEDCLPWLCSMMNVL